MQKFKFLFIPILVIFFLLFVKVYNDIESTIGISKDHFLEKKLDNIVSQELKNFIKLKFFKKKIEEIQTKEKFKFSKKITKGEFELNKKKTSLNEILLQRINLKNYTFKTFSNKELLSSGPRSYLEIYDENLFLITGVGNLFFANISDTDKEKILFSEIITNLTDFINQELAFKINAGVKDIFIDKQNIYVSFIKKKDNDCYYNSIVVGKINLKKIYFETFFETKECSDSKYLSQSGGAISNFNNSILLTVGDYRSVEKKKSGLPQSLDSFLGKIIEINKSTKKFNMISLGHRNPQGIYYDNENDVIINTEHGPFGGCEINLNFFPKVKIKNFGWPIASYGKHYESTLKNNPSAFFSSPLYKSHSNHGFEEPLLYFNPALAPTQIVNISDLISKNGQHYLIGTLGQNNRYSKSLYYLRFNKKYKLIEKSYIKINERIRDIVVSKKYQNIFVFLESNATLLVIEKK